MSATDDDGKVFVEALDVSASALLLLFLLQFLLAYDTLCTAKSTQLMKPLNPRPGKVADTHTTGNTEPLSSGRTREMLC